MIFDDQDQQQDDQDADDHARIHLNAPVRLGIAKIVSGGNALQS
jgi:hypothetical protein